MASNPPVVTKERCCFPDPAAMYRWDKASLGQMIFYPLMLSVVLTASLFAFNVNYPKFRFLTTRKIYVVLFATIFALIFLTSFATLAPVRWERLGKFFLTFVLAIPTTLVVLAAIAFALFLILTKSEKNNEPIDQDSDVKDLQEIHKREDENAAHNHMISIQRLLPEQWRQRFFLPLALHGVRLVLGKHVYRPGFLATVGTVHYARWIQLAKTNNFVFVSNYDGSWESYLEDFITKSSMGMTAIWSNCIGFPKTKTLIFGGADDGDRFKRYARKSMKPTSFWYSAYPELTADQIRRNTLLRDGLARITSPSDAEAWVDLLGSIPRPTFDLQSDSIQSLVFGGSGNLKCGRMIVVRSKNIGGVDPKFQQWVSEVQKHVTFGDAPPQKHALYLGLSSQGMEYLQYKCGAPQKGTQDDLAEENRIKFPPAFTMGMDHPARASILGDLETHTDCEGPPVRPTAPNWNWGYQKDPGCPTEPRKAAHAVLLIYGEMVTSKRKNARRAKISESAHFKSFVNEQLSLIGKFGLEHDDPIEFNRLPETGLPKEPFGFVDGISQPIVKGTNQARGRGQSIHAVNPGEIVLGYKDNRDFFPPSPQVLADLDKDKILPATPRTQPQRYPKFKPDNDDIYRDLGRNGTYLVIRQLEQDVGRFKKAVNDTAKEFDCESQRLARKMVKAKFMGRWPDGQPLIKRPVNLVKNGENFKLECGKPRKSLSREDNEFLLGMEDPQGHKCPYGSHIRRSNPRDGLDVENEDSLSIVNRHRILRRGRGYQEEDENGVMREGTMFMCLNADIERQFEFVQQTWVGSCKFHGLTDEMDPIAGQGYYKLDPETGERMFKDDDFGFTIQDPARSVRVGGLKPFVTMKGGGYFFIPSREALEFLATKRDD
jgi:deferrochelatase/peroxidase EfeB